jgi:hypothetical protein
VANREYARLVYQRQELIDGRYLVTVKWEGNPCLPIVVDPRFSSREFEIAQQSWPLVKIGQTRDWMKPCDVYARTDVGLGIPARYHRLRYWLRRKTGPLKARIVMTAMIWGLAYVPEGEIITWSHLGKRRKD